MSGAAEGIAGLALGAISVAALFTTCIECFDIIVAGKNFSEDYEQLCTLVSPLNVIAERMVVLVGCRGAGQLHIHNRAPSCVEIEAEYGTWGLKVLWNICANHYLTVLSATCSIRALGRICGSDTKSMRWASAAIR
jgi:hypothetical protein